MIRTDVSRLVDQVKDIVADLGELPLPEGAVWQESGRNPGWRHCTAGFGVPANLDGRWDDLVAFVARRRRETAAELLALVEKNRPAGGGGSLVVLRKWWMRATVIPGRAADPEPARVVVDCTVRYEPGVPA